MMPLNRNEFCRKRSAGTLTKDDVINYLLFRTKKCNQVLFRDNNSTNYVENEEDLSRYTADEEYSAKKQKEENEYFEMCEDEERERLEREEFEKRLDDIRDRYPGVYVDSYEVGTDLDEIESRTRNAEHLIFWD